MKKNQKAYIKHVFITYINKQQAHSALESSREYKVNNSTTITREGGRLHVGKHICVAGQQDLKSQKQHLYTKIRVIQVSIQSSYMYIMGPT